MTMRGKAIGIFLVMLVTGLVIAAKTSVTDIEKFNWVSEKTATGGQPTIEQIGALKHAGFRTIVNLRERSEYDAAAEEAAAKEADEGRTSSRVHSLRHRQPGRGVLDDPARRRGQVGSRGRREGSQGGWPEE